MSDSEPPYNIAAIHRLLLEAFIAKDLYRLCRDHPDLGPIVTRTSPEQGLDDMANEVIEYCRTHLAFEDLLAAVAEENPRQYARFEPELRLVLPQRKASPAPTAPPVQPQAAPVPATKALQASPRPLVVRRFWLLIGVVGALVVALMCFLIVILPKDGPGQAAAVSTTAPPLGVRTATAEGFFIINMLSDKCIDAKGKPGTANGTPLQLAGCEFDDPNTDQKWEFSGGFLQNALSGKCLEVKGTPGVKNQDPLQLWDCQFSDPNTTDQRWEITSGGFIRNLLSGKCIDVWGKPGIKDEAPLQLWDCELSDPSTDQKWRTMP